MSYYLTRQLVKAIDKLREQLEAASQQEVEAIRQSEKATRDNKQDPLPTTLRVLAENYTEHAEKKEQNAQQSKSHGIQIWIAIATTLAFIAAAYYAAVARSQAVDMHVATEANIKSLQEAQISLEVSQNQFDRTMHQIVNQTVAQVKAANAAQQALNVNASLIRSQNGVPNVIVDPYVPWYYQSATHNCAAGNVCAVLIIHNTSEKTEATNVRVAAKIAILPAPPESIPNNWRTPVSSVIPYSPKMGSGHYPDCPKCIYFLVSRPLVRKAGTLYVWGVVGYYNYGIYSPQTSRFCFQTTSYEVFVSTAVGTGSDDANHQCPIPQTQDR